MKTARQQLFDMAEHADAYAKDYKTLLALQIQAVNEFLPQQRERIPLLGRRVREAGLNSVTTVQDMAPLLFPHSAYKSYPHAFLQNRRWDKMFQWLKTVAAVRDERVDLGGIESFDQWIACMWQAGNRIGITSGTSGKPSILNASAEDHERVRHVVRHNAGIDKSLQANRGWHFFQVTPREGPYAMMVMAQAQADFFGRPDSCHYLSDEPLTVAAVSRAIDMRKRMADGTATPQEIAEFETEAASRQRDMDKNFERMAQKLADVRHEPIWLVGVWPQIWILVEHLRKLGLKPGEFHRDSVIIGGGGRKGAAIPEDFEQRIVDFLNPDMNHPRCYGMSEMAGAFPGCEAGRYHQMPWVVTCLMDDAGERVVEQQGVVTGRFAFIDLVWEGRWGGLITGDKVTIDFGPCPCGRPGPAVLSDIVRYQDLGDDKIGCAGTIDAYITGALA